MRNKILLVPPPFIYNRSGEMDQPESKLLLIRVRGKKRGNGRAGVGIEAEPQHETAGCHFGYSDDVHLSPNVSPQKTKASSGPNQVKTEPTHSWPHLPSVQVTVLTYPGVGDQATAVFVSFSSFLASSVNKEISPSHF